MPDKRELGERIKRLRLSRDLTLKEVERKAKVSATHISEIERGLTSPTVGAMSRIAMALGVPASRLIERDILPGASVVRGRERRTLVDPDSGARFVSLSGPIQRSRMSVVEVQLPPEPAGGVARVVHRGEEFVHVQRGVVEIVIETGRHILKEGDSIHFRPRAEHTFRNIGDGPARLLWVARPPVGL